MALTVKCAQSRPVRSVTESSFAVVLATDQRVQGVPNHTAHIAPLRIQERINDWVRGQVRSCQLPNLTSTGCAIRRLRCCIAPDTRAHPANNSRKKRGRPGLPVGVWVGSEAGGGIERWSGSANPGGRACCVPFASPARGSGVSCRKKCIGSRIPRAASRRRVSPGPSASPAPKAPRSTKRES